MRIRFASRLTILAVAFGVLLASACFDWSTGNDGPTSDGGPTDAPFVDGVAEDAVADAPTDAGTDGAMSGPCASCVVAVGGLGGRVASVAASPDGKRVYWADGRTLVGMHSGGGTSSTLDTLGRTPRLVTASNTAVYVADGQAVVRYELSGGSTVVRNGVDATSLAWSEPGLFAVLFSEGPTAFSCANTNADCEGGLTTVTAPAPLAAVEGGEDYFVLVTTTGALHNYNNQSLDTVDGGVGVSAIASSIFDTRNVVWAANVGTEGALRSVGTGITLELLVPARVTAIARDATSVFYVTSSKPGRFDVWRIDAALASDPVKLATDQIGVTQIAVALDGIFFGRQNGVSWELVRAAK